MKKCKIYFFLFLFVFVSASCVTSDQSNIEKVPQKVIKLEPEISGKILFIDDNLNNTKLSGVTVVAFPEEVITPFIESKKISNEEALKAEYDRLKEHAVNTLLKLGKATDRYNADLAYIQAVRFEYDAPISRLKTGLQKVRSLDIQEEQISQIKSFSDMSLLNAKEALKKLNYEAGAERYFATLPKGVNAAVSDDQGMFVIKLPKPGRYALAAQTRKETAKKTEVHHWLVWVDAAENQKNEIVLNDNNTTKSDAPISLIKTKYYEN